MERGWKKLPDLENSFVWFGEDPPDVTDILKKSSFDNHVCRYMIGILKDVGLLEGTGVSPNQSEGRHPLPGGVDHSTPSILKYFSKANKASRALEMGESPDIKESDEESD